MYESTIATYSLLDDLLKALNHSEDVRQQVSNAQTITTAIVAARIFGGDFERANLILHELGWFLMRISRSRFSRRLPRPEDVLQLLFHHVRTLLKELNLHSRDLPDSVSGLSLRQHPHCSLCRLTARVLEKEDYRGKIASKRCYLYGVRVQLLTTI